MNKLTKGLLTISLSALLVGTAAACGGSKSWGGTTFKDYGAVKVSANGGFVVETDNYVYFINGIESSSSDNTFGTPVKGALVAAKKADLNDSQVVIPELMTSSDYDAGIYLFGSGEETYAYYGTPNREKTSTGEIASSEMTFTRTRLDGKKNEKLFTVSSFSTNYRIAQAEDGTVYIVYYDTANTSLMSFNCTTKKSTVIAKTDAKTNEKTDKGEYLSLGDYKFLKNGNSAQVVFTMTAYTQEYFSEQEEQTNSYSRQTATHNYLYIYTAGAEKVCIKDGSEKRETYAVKSQVGEYLFYTATPSFGGTAKTFGVKLSDTENATEIKNDSIIKDDMIIGAGAYDEVYYLDTDAKQVIKNTLVGDVFDNKKTILKDETVSSLINVDDSYIYCFNTDGYIVAIERDDENGDGRTVRISERTASASWYKPETVTVGDAEYMLYADSSAEGNSYVYRSDLNKLGDPKEVKNDDNETDYYYLESSFIGVRPAADRAAVVSTKINAIEKPLDLKKGDDDKYTAESVEIARAAYNALDDDAKAEISADDLKKLTNAENALTLADAFAKLEKVVGYKSLSDEKKTALKEELKTDYDAAKAIVDGYGSDVNDIRSYLGDKLNLNYYYQQAVTIFDPVE